jgi:hypothetical protein
MSLNSAKKARFGEQDAPFTRRVEEGLAMNNRNREQVLQMLLVIEAVKEAVEKFEQGEVNLTDTLNAITSAVSLGRVA